MKTAAPQTKAPAPQTKASEKLVHSAFKEKAIQNDIFRAFGTLPGLRLWRANVGVARVGTRVIRFGIPGQADLTGILPDGRRLEIEVKSSTGRQTPKQVAFQNMIERFNGIYILARSTNDVRQRLAALGIKS
jgi:hypothetical protein